MKGSRVSLLIASPLLLKKVGKPDWKDQAPEYKQAYLPYEVAPSKMELDRERKKFSQAYCGKEEHRKLVEVKDVPQNMYTYGKEGFVVPIAIFKDQTDPVVGPEWTYPGIYENKIVCKHYFISELTEREEKDSFESPWLRNSLRNQLNKHLGLMKFRMSIAKMKQINVFHKERGATKKVGAVAAMTGAIPSATSATVASGK